MYIKRLEIDNLEEVKNLFRSVFKNELEEHVSLVKKFE